MCGEDFELKKWIKNGIFRVFDPKKLGPGGSKISPSKIFQTVDQKFPLRIPELNRGKSY